jgi:hypothetical protein
MDAILQISSPQVDRGDPEGLSNLYILANNIITKVGYVLFITFGCGKIFFACLKKQ